MPTSPAELVNQRNITGQPRVVRDIIADLYNNIQKWNIKHVTGAAIVQQITIIKSQGAEQLPSGLESLVTQLYEVVQCLKTCCNALTFSRNQITSLVKLQKDCEPMFITLTIEQMANLLNEIVDAYEEELKVMKMVVCGLIIKFCFIL